MLIHSRNINRPHPQHESCLHPYYIIPVSCSHQAELLRLSGCLAAWVEVVGEVAEGPERQQRGPEVVVQQGGDARGPEEAWHMVLQAAS